MDILNIIIYIFGAFGVLGFIKFMLRDKLRTDNLGMIKLTRLDIACPSAIEVVDLEDCDKEITISDAGEASQ